MSVTCLARSPLFFVCAIDFQQEVILARPVLSRSIRCVYGPIDGQYLSRFFLLLELEYALFSFIFLTFLQFRICYAVLNKNNNSFIFIFLCFFSSEFQNQHIQEHQIQQNHQQNNQNNQHIQIQSQPATNKRGKGGADAKPRGRMTAYAFFVQTCREEHKKKHPEETVIFAEFSRKCAERWKVCTISLFLLYFGQFFFVFQKMISVFYNFFFVSLYRQCWTRRRRDFTRWLRRTKLDMI